MKIKPLTPKDINVFSNNKTLFSVDYRVLSENMDYKIPAMWKYENLLGWVLEEKTVILNEDADQMDFPNSNTKLLAQKDSDPRLSVYKRVKSSEITDFENLWVGVPNPDADVLAQENNLILNYSFEDFKLYNDKLKQKKVLKDFTPEWEVIQSINDVRKFQNKKTGYIKRSYGSGGYTVFHVSNLNTNFDELFNEEKNSIWYFEEEIDGDPCSLQCYKDENEITIFGYSKQIIQDKKHYCGSEMYPLEELSNKPFLKEIEKITELCSDFLKGYQGFFGIDFIVDSNQKVYVLELNVRITAVTIPTLIKNNVSAQYANFYEDIVNTKDEEGFPITLAISNNNEKDILLLKKNKNENFGKYHFIDISKTKNCPMKVNDLFVEKVSNVVGENVSMVIKKDFYNFWPYGWTITLLLAESHCVFTSWYLEKKVFVDLFCCNMFYDEKNFNELIAEFFEGEVNESLLNIR